MKMFIQLKKNEHGQSMVELAIVVTILMILLAGTVDLGRAFFTWLAMRDAAQEGAAYGSIEPYNTAELQDRVIDNLEQVVNDPLNDIDVVPTIHGGACQGDTIQVDVIYKDFPITMPFLGTILGTQAITITATVQDTVLTPPCH